MSDDAAEQKEHEPTAKRQIEMLEKGKTLRSKDLSGAILLVAAILMLLFMSEKIATQIKDNFTLAFSGLDVLAHDETRLFEITSSLFVTNFLMLLPFFAVLVIAAFSSVFVFGGWNFSMKAVKFNPGKMNPLNNLKVIFSKRMFVEVAKSSIKFSIIVAAFYYFLLGNEPDILSLPYLQTKQAMLAFYHLLHKFVILIFIGVFVIVAIDLLITYFTFMKNSKMTTQEVRDEHKDLEGNADVKRKRRQMQRSLARQKIPQTVPLATVVITNPTHYAVALRYRENEDKAPVIIAMGQGSIAQYIRRLASAHGVPIYEEPPLARAIFYTGKLNAPINPGLYMAVAFVLAYINQLRRYQHGQGPLPNKAPIELPPQFIFDA